jgi:hypothetical protein
VSRGRFPTALVLAPVVGLSAAAAGGDPGSVTLRYETIVGAAVSMDVPPGWDGRVLYLDATGEYGAVFQVANFELPANDGFEPPAELPPGEEDPIKAMGAGDVLVMVTTGAATGSPAPAELSLADLELVTGGRVPVGHQLARGAFCRDLRCVDVEVDFGAAPGEELTTEVDGVLASIALAEGGS